MSMCRLAVINTIPTIYTMYQHVPGLYHPCTSYKYIYTIEIDIIKGLVVHWYTINKGLYARARYLRELRAGAHEAYIGKTVYQCTILCNRL